MLGNGCQAKLGNVDVVAARVPANFRYIFLQVWEPPDFVGISRKPEMSFVLNIL